MCRLVFVPLSLHYTLFSPPALLTSLLCHPPTPLNFILLQHFSLFLHFQILPYSFTFSFLNPAYLFPHSFFPSYSHILRLHFVPLQHGPIWEVIGLLGTCLYFNIICHSSYFLLLFSILLFVLSPILYVWTSVEPISSLYIIPHILTYYVCPVRAAEWAASLWFFILVLLHSPIFYFLILLFVLSLHFFVSDFGVEQASLYNGPFSSVLKLIICLVFYVNLRSICCYLFFLPFSPLWI